MGRWDESCGDNKGGMDRIGDLWCSRGGRGRRDWGGSGSWIQREPGGGRGEGWLGDSGYGGYGVGERDCGCGLVVGEGER